MFFVQELFTQHHKSLSVVWLAAHWDPRRLTRSRIAHTAIPKTVDDITNAHSLFSLRLSGTLMLGVARIYARKAQFLLDDCSNVVFKMHNAFHARGAVDAAESSAPASAITLHDASVDARLLGIDLYDLRLPAFDTPFDVGLSSSQHTSALHDITIEPGRFDVHHHHRASQSLGRTFADDDGFGSAGPEEMADLSAIAAPAMDIGRRAATPPRTPFLDTTISDAGSAFRPEDMPLEEGGFGGSHDAYEGDPLIAGTGQFGSPGFASSSTGLFATSSPAKRAASVAPSDAAAPQAAAPPKRRRVARVDTSRQLSRAALKRQLEDTSDIVRKRLTPATDDEAASALLATDARTADALLRQPAFPVLAASSRDLIEGVFAPPPVAALPVGRVQEQGEEEEEGQGRRGNKAVTPMTPLSGERYGESHAISTPMSGFRAEDMPVEEMGFGGRDDGYVYDPLMDAPSSAVAMTPLSVAASAAKVTASVSWVDDVANAKQGTRTTFKEMCVGKRRAAVAAGFLALVCKADTGAIRVEQKAPWATISVIAA